MTELTADQISFLQSQNIPLSSVFDASGMRKSDYPFAMRVEGKRFAFGVTPCKAAGHTLRTRAGHCIQCDPSKIAFMLRHDSWAHIYIAGSKAGRLIKIGYTTDVDVRIDTLNSEEYGGQKDWQILATAFHPQAGRVEFFTHAKLELFAVPGEYVKDGRPQKCYELFRCNFVDALDALQRGLGEAGVLYVPDQEYALAAFQFR